MFINSILEYWFNFTSEYPSNLHDVGGLSSMLRSSRYCLDGEVVRLADQLRVQAGVVIAKTKCWESFLDHGQPGADTMGGPCG